MAIGGVSEHEVRIGRVETDVQSVRTEVGVLTGEVTGLKSDVRGLGSILNRIEQGVLRAQERSEEREQLQKPNLVAVVSVLITIVTVLVGGAWVIGGQLSRMDERSVWIQRQLELTEARLWQSRNGRGEGDAKTEAPQD